MAAILANRLVLNLRSFKHSNSSPGGVELGLGGVPNLGDNSGNAEVDEFFRTTYGRRSNGKVSNNHHSVIDTVLGNIGEPLRVGEDDNGDGDEDEEVKDIQSEASTTSEDIGHHT